MMSLSTGDKLGPYEILSPLGAGEVVTTTVAGALFPCSQRGAAR